MLRLIKKYFKSRNIKHIIRYHEKEYDSWIDIASKQIDEPETAICLEYANRHRKEISRLLNELETL